MKRFKPAKITARIHSRHSKKPLYLDVPITVNASGTGNSSYDKNLDSLPMELTSEPNGVSQHENRVIKSVNNWTGVHTQLLSAFIEENCLPPEAVCIVCLKEPAIIRCLQCGPQVFTCQACCLTCHSTVNHFHTPEIWKVSFNLYKTTLSTT